MITALLSRFKKKPKQNQGIFGGAEPVVMDPQLLDESGSVEDLHDQQPLQGKVVLASKKPGGFKLEVQHLPPIKVRRCRHLVRLTSSFNLKIASPLPA